MLMELLGGFRQKLLELLMVQGKVSGNVPQNLHVQNHLYKHADK